MEAATIKGRRLRRWFGPLLGVLAAFLVVGLIAPFINAARFSGRIKDALETSLGRKVEFESVYFTLFSGPGFSLENVGISEDPAFGLEPFAFVPTVQARLRLDKLFLGQIRFTSLRLVSPSLNIARRADGAWNVVELIQRITTPRRAPLNLFPAFEVTDGRLNFKWGPRKGVLYISETELSIYPERSGRLFFSFSGSPARTDRAGMGFGHFRGTVNWILNLPASDRNQVRAEVVLDPSNLSELTTLIEGHDAGVHGTISSRLRITGPPSNLKVKGELRLNDVHRWDLLPASGEEWAVHYGGEMDARARRIDLRTLPAQAGETVPVAMRIHVNDFLSSAGSSVIAELKDAPLTDLLPLVTRMGVDLPKGADLHGTVNGAIGYSNDSGWAGGLVIEGAEAKLRGSHTLRAPSASLTISNDHIHFDPTVLEAGDGKLKVSGDYFLARQEANVMLNATDVSVAEFKPLATSWFGGLGALGAIREGNISGQFVCSYRGWPLRAAEDAESPLWSGQFLLRDAAIAVPGLSDPVEAARARVSFHSASFEVERLSGTVGGQPFRASYRYNPALKFTERLRLEFPKADLANLADALTADNLAGSFWSRLRFGQRSLPGWLQNRNLEGEVSVDHLSAGGRALGELSSHFVWRGAAIQFSDATLKMAQGAIDGQGSVDLAPYDPRWRFTAAAVNYPWAGGSLNAKGEFASKGAGQELLRNVTAAGTFSGENLRLSPGTTLEDVAGSFRLTFGEGWPDLRLSNIQATQNGDDWSGEGLTQSDGKLLVTLDHAGREVHLESSLDGGSAPAPLSVVPQPGDAEAGSRAGLKVR